MIGVDARIKLFRGVQRYFIGAAFVAQSTAVVFLWNKVVDLTKENATLQVQHAKEIRGFVDYFREKGDELQKKLDESNELNKELFEKSKELQRIANFKINKR